MIVCKNCGTQNGANESFCGECGAYLEWEGERVGEPEPVAAAAAPAAPAADPGSHGLMQRVRDAVGIGAHDGAPPDASAPGHAPPDASSGASQTPAPNPPLTPSQGPFVAPPAGSSNGGAATAGPAPWPAAPPTAPAGPPGPAGPAGNAAGHNGGSALVVPIAPAAPADRAAPARPDVAAPAPGAPTQPGSAPVRPASGAVRPGAAPPRPRRRDLPPEDRAPAPGETICGYCAAGNAPTRKFCRRCGTDLADAPVAKKPPWYKRIFAKRTASAAPVAGARPKAVKQKRHRKGFGQARYYVIAFLGIAIVAFVMFQSFWINAYNTVMDRVDSPSQTTVQRITGSSSAKGHPVGNLTDGQPSTFWAPEPGKRAVGQRVVATFKSPSRLVYLGILNGPSDQPDKFVKQGNVSRIEVVVFRKGAGAQTMSFDVKSQGGLQRLDIGVNDVTSVRVVIRGVTHPANSGRLIAIGELEFFTR